jgi:group I intron endonuclease
MMLQRNDSDVRLYLAALRAAGPRAYGVVYLITNIENGKCYIGQTTEKVPFNRYFRHLKEARRGSDRLLYRAIRAHGEGAFMFEIIANCDDQKSLDATEDYFISTFGSLVPAGYNLQGGGAQGKRSEDLKIKLSMIHSAPETKRRHSEAILQCWADPEHREGIQATWDAKARLAEPERRRREEERRQERAAARLIWLPKRNAAIRASRENPDVLERIGAGTRGGLWIYRGLESRRLKDGESLPEGWLYGRGKTHGRC